MFCVCMYSSIGSHHSLFGLYIYIEKQEYLIYINESKENKDYKDIFSPRYNLKNRNLQGLAFGPSYILIKDKQFITLFPTYNLRR